MPPINYINVLSDYEDISIEDRSYKILGFKRSKHVVVTSTLGEVISTQPSRGAAVISSVLVSYVKDCLINQLIYLTVFNKSIPQHWKDVGYNDMNDSFNLTSKQITQILSGVHSAKEPIVTEKELRAGFKFFLNKLNQDRTVLRECLMRRKQFYSNDIHSQVMLAKILKNLDFPNKYLGFGELFRLFDALLKTSVAKKQLRVDMELEKNGQ